MDFNLYSDSRVKRSVFCDRIAAYFWSYWQHGGTPQDFERVATPFRLFSNVRLPEALLPTGADHSSASDSFCF